MWDMKTPIIRGNEATVRVSLLALAARIRSTAKVKDLTKLSEALALSKAITEEVAPYVTESQNSHFEMLLDNGQQFGRMRRFSLSEILHYLRVHNSEIDSRNYATPMELDFVTGAARYLILKGGKLTAFRHGMMDDLSGKTSRNATFFRNTLKKITERL
jgi:hypothetical protein